MNSKIIISLIIGSLLFIGCGNSNVNELPTEFINQQKEIIKEQKEILKNTPNDLSAQFEVAYRYQLINEDKKAISGYKDILKKDPKHFPALNNLADIYEDQKKYDLAAEKIKELYIHNPANAEVINDTVRILLKNNEPKEAKEALENYAKVIDAFNNPELGVFISNLFDTIQKYESKNN